MNAGRIIGTIAMALLLSGVVVQVSNAQYFSSYHPNDDFFKYKVKLIDEFIERFNDEPTSNLRKEYARDKKKYDIPRSMLVVSLFDLENTGFTNDSALNGFFRQVLDKVHPVHLSFNDSDWYAEARAIFLYNGKPVEMPLIMHVKSDGDEWSKWMITGIGNRVPSSSGTSNVYAGGQESKEVARFIPTSAYATNFVELHYILSRNMEPGYFFEPQLTNSPAGKSFTDQVTSGQLKFQYVKDITFHFYQVSGWIFTVAHFGRRTTNSGWLISSVTKAAPAEKAAARGKLLNR